MKEKWQEKADELISSILDEKEQAKDLLNDINSDKTKLAELLEEHNVNEYTGEFGKANFVDFERQGLVKDAVEETVNDVNKGKVNHIEMKDLTKDIKVHFINVRGFAE